MKKLLSIFMVLGLVTMLSGQGLKFGVGGGLSMFTGPASLTDEYPKGVGYASEPMITVKGKFSLPLLPFALTGTVNYVMLGSEGKGNAMPPLIPIAHTVEISSSILMVGVGGEYALIPGPLPIKPYISLDVFLSSFGKSTYKYAYSNGTSGEFTGDGVTRYGMSIGAGVDLTLLPMFDVNVFAKYNLLNLVGKEDGEDGVSSISLGAMVIF